MFKEWLEQIKQKPEMAVITIAAVIVLVGVTIASVFTGAKKHYISFEKWADKLNAGELKYVEMQKLDPDENLVYIPSEKEFEQICVLLKSIEEEDCDRRKQEANEYDIYSLQFVCGDNRVLLHCLSNKLIRYVANTEMPNFAPEGEDLFINCPQLWEYIVNKVDTRGKIKDTVDEPESESMVRIPQAIYEANVDLNHDGNTDRLLIMTDALENRAWLDLSANGAYIQVYLGNSDGKCMQAPVYTSDLVCSSHAGNGTYVLAKKDNKDYLIYSLMQEEQGSAHYTYSVMCIQDNKMVKVKEDTVNFYCDPFMPQYWKEGPRREDVIPAFKAGFEPWIKDARILISYDVATPEFLPRYSDPIPASSYYDMVWERNEKEMLEEFQANVGTKNWQMDLFWSIPTFEHVKPWIEQQLATDYAQWFIQYDGSKLQRIDNCKNSSNGDACGVPDSCDIVYYRPSGGENLQDVLYKMIESMIRKRMVESDKRPYVITDYAIPEQELLQVSEDMWIIKFLKGYYAFEGSDMGTMQDYINGGTTVTEDGLIPFFAQGSDEVFYFVLMEKDGVYRLENMHKMMN